MRKILLAFSLMLSGLLYQQIATAQLVLTPYANPTELAQRLVGDGVTISNVSFTGNTAMAAKFLNTGNNNIDIDSGIVLTTGRARTVGSNYGVNGNGSTSASSITASEGWFLPGDTDLANAIGLPVSELEDACILEFDFIPLGDSIKFSYVFSSEEYTSAFVCLYNDAFAFFISGPGITGMKNIALVPGTSTPVSIFNVNNVQHGNPANACINNPSYYINNGSNTQFTHNGHTTRLQALEQVIPCQVYHLKLVISDVGDDLWDSGVFLEARSLTSSNLNIAPVTQIDPNLNVNYLVEGCIDGSIEIKREITTQFSQTVYLDYAGTAINGVDFQTLPTNVVIPANQSSTSFSISTIVDNLPEGTETLKIYTRPGCASSNIPPTDSIIVEIRDFDLLTITPDSLTACNNTPVQLDVATGYMQYSWDADPTLSSTTIANPVALPVDKETTYYCTASVNDCHARDSVFIAIKDIEFVSQVDVNCAGGQTGQIQVASGAEWIGPVTWSVNNGPEQPDSSFQNLPIGQYWVRITDVDGCRDSLEVNLVQAFPDLLSTIQTSPATCSGDPDGSIEVTATGGNQPYTYSIDGGNTYQSSPNFSVRLGTYDVVILDANGCSRTEQVEVGFVNDLTVDAGTDEAICEGTSIQLQAVSNALSYTWSPNIFVSDPNNSSTTVSPIRTQKYFVKAVRGVCEVIDSVTVTVLEAPIPAAGLDVEICFGANTQLQAGSGFAEYSWTPSTYLSDVNSASPMVIRPVNDIVYYLSVVDHSGCASLRYDTVSVSVTPPVALFAGNDTVIGINQPLQLHVVDINSSGIQTWTWSPAYGLDDPGSANPIAILDRDQEYIVTGITSANCEGSDTIKVKAYVGPEIYVPTGFTPNGDGLNDQIKAFAVGMNATRYFKIYNRWGHEIFSTSDFTKGWDGRIKGKLQPIGSYVWVAQAIDFRGNVINRKGVFTLIQ